MQIEKSNDQKKGVDMNDSKNRSILGLLFIFVQVYSQDKQQIKLPVTKKISIQHKSQDSFDKLRDIAQQPMHMKNIILVNCRINDLCIEIVDSKNKKISLIVRAGRQLDYWYEYSLQKLVCFDKTTSKITVTAADLKNYKVLVFNDDQKIDKYHFESLKEKSRALQQARNGNDKKLWQDISEQAVYHP